MLNKILQDCKTEWIKSKVKKNHPFRYFSLATTSKSGDPEVRLVVLRKYDADQCLFTIYTDSRSSKMTSLAQNTTVELMFYDPKKLLQIRVRAECIEQKRDEQLFKQQHLGAQKDYTTTTAPGSVINQMDAVKYSDIHHFNVLVFKAFQIDFLRLKRPNHQRAVFYLEAGEWKGNFVTP